MVEAEQRLLWQEACNIMKCREVIHLEPEQEPVYLYKGVEKNIYKIKWRWFSLVE